MKLTNYTVEELEWAIIDRKRIDEKSFFLWGHTVYDPTLWEEKVALYQSGGKINLRNAFYDPPKYKERFEDNIISSIEDFESLIYDYFIKELESHRIKEWIVGLNGCLNPRKETPNFYMDGMCFFTCRTEFMQCLMHYKIDRLYSFVTHMGFGRHEQVIK